MNAKLIKKYLQASSVSLVAKVLVMLSAVGVLYIVNQVLDKDGFGLFMLALAICLLLAMVVSGAFCSLILYHVSRGRFEKRTVEFSLFWGPIAAGICAYGLYLGAGFISALMGKPEMVIWLESLALLVPAYSANFILTSYYRAQQKVERMLIFQEILPSILKIVLLGGVWALGLPDIWLGYGFALSFLLPFLVMYGMKPIIPQVRSGSLSWWDLRYSGMISVNQVINKSTRNLLIVFIGFFASAGVIAELVVAMRIAQFLLVPKLMLAQLHVPRMGAKLGEGDRAGLMAEFDYVRRVSLLLTLLGTGFLVMFGAYVLTLFGAYSGAYPLLLLLCVVSIIRAGFGDVGGFMSMAGHSFSAFLSNLVSLGVMVMALVLLVADYGAFGAGVALMITAFVNMGGFAVLLYYHDRFKVMSWLSSITMGTSSFLLLILAFKAFTAG